MNIWRFPYFIKKPSLVQIGLQLFKWGHFHIFSLSYNLTPDDLWPWYMTFDLINKWGFPCCIYDPILVEIYQSLWKIEPNVNPFFTTDNNNKQQGTKWSLCVFPAKAGDTKSDPYVSFLLRQVTQKLPSPHRIRVRLISWLVWPSKSRLLLHPWDIQNWVNESEKSICPFGDLRCKAIS